MSPLDALVGHERPLGALRRALAAGRLGHAYLLAGPTGIGKATCARAVAAALNCEVARGAGCAACGACLRIAAGVHPDVLTLVPEGAAEQIKVEPIRGLIERLGLHRHEGRARVVILDGADRLNDQAGNALLKTLEEPPAATHFFLITAAPERTLATVRSRCQRLGFGPLPAGAIAGLLAARGIDGALATRAAARAEGSAGRALALCDEPERLEGRAASARRLLAAARSGGAEEIVAAAQELGGDREAVAEALDDLQPLLRDALLLAAGAAGGRVERSEAERAELEGLARRAGLRGVLRRLRTLAELRAALHGNANPTLAAERALLALGAPARAERA